MRIKITSMSVLLLVMVCTAAWAAPIPTYVAEFSVSGASLSNEMKSSIQTLLLSRLASDTITTQSKPEGAVITVSGSYLLSGNIFSLDATVKNRDGAVVTRAFAQGKSPDDLVPAVATLAKSLLEGIDKGVVQQKLTPSVSEPSDIVTSIKVAPAASAMTVLRLDGTLNAIARGRTFADGERELFLSGDHTLRYYRQGGALKLLAEIPYKIHEKILSVETADLDGDTIPELYVTIIDGEKLVSQVWKVGGTSLTKVAGPLPYYFRTITGVNGSKKLYAQEISGTNDFAGDVAEVSLAGNRYVLSNPVTLPKTGNIFNFTLLSGAKGDTYPLVFTQNGYLKVYNPSGDEIFKSGEEFGGSENGFKRYERAGETLYRQVYLEQRVVTKANGELIIPQNSGSWFMLGKHSYAKNVLYCFTWDGAGLVEKWHTNISDYYLADFAYDETAHELIALEVVGKEEGVFSKGSSRLVIRKVK